MIKLKFADHTHHGDGEHFTVRVDLPNVAPGDNILLVAAHDENLVVRAIVSRITYIRFIDLAKVYDQTRHHARYNYPRAVQALREFYPDLQLQDPVAVVFYYLAFEPDVEGAAGVLGGRVQDSTRRLSGPQSRPR